jgi:simple sugar transport system ATP-binding protein/ribose transport system ATP-binding protein
VTSETRLQDAHVTLAGISKSFGGTRALEAVSLDIARGSIHALVGENGAGKSTLGKILTGVIAPDAGQLLLAGEPVSFHSPHAAISRGIVLINQELSLVPALTVAQNVFLGTEPARAGFLRGRALRRRFTQLAASAGFGLDPDRPAGSLRIADQQKTEILRALGRDASLIVMDEPTAALSRPDALRLHEVIRRLAAGGTTIVLVSHFLGEVLSLAQVVTILRDGRVVRTAPAAQETEDSILNAMLGRSLGSTFPPKRPAGTPAPVLLSATGVSAAGVSGVSLEVRAGEILGLAGLVGAGRSELAHALQGASRLTGGTVTLAGGVHPRWAHPRRALAAGVVMIPESRKEQGLLPGRSVTENVSLASLAAFSRFGVMRRRAERRAVADVLRRVMVRGPAQSAPVSALSGGNQQKVLFARMLLCQPRVLIADEPTRGVDVGARRAIYDLLTGLAAAGLGVLLISSDVEEILGLAHRVLVMRAGSVTAELTGDGMTEAAILGAAFDASERGES